MNIFLENRRIFHEALQNTEAQNQGEAPQDSDSTTFTQCREGQKTCTARIKNTIYEAQQAGVSLPLSPEQNLDTQKHQLIAQVFSEHPNATKSALQKITPKNLRPLSSFA